MSNHYIPRAERRQAGKNQREESPRENLGDWKMREKKPGIVELLEESNKGRIKGLIPVRYGRMAQSAFHFFRGSAIIQARDQQSAVSSGVIVQACGDCHLGNFGGFATPERSLAFDINDFDETFPAPFEWDLKRLVASLVLASRYNGFGDANARDAVRACTSTYRKRIEEYSQLTLLQTWYNRITVDDLIEYFGNNKDAQKRLARRKEEASSRTSEAVFPKLTKLVNGRPQIVDDPPLIYHFQSQVKDLKESREKLISEYRQSLVSDRRALFDRYVPIDSAIKVVGVGSVGTRCMISLLMADDDDPLFLQVKEARRSVLEKPTGKSRYAHQGERVVAGQRLMQAATDMFIGWASGPEKRHYFVRQLRDQKVSAELESMKKGTLVAYADICGWALARAHAKAGDAALLLGYIGTSARLDEAMERYSIAYADQVEADFDVFTRAIRRGHLRTDTSSEIGQEFNL